MPAPVALFVYNRPWHTRQTVEALLRNELAADSNLFIFSDAPKNRQAQAEVDEVRAYIRTVAGFRSVSIVESVENFGLAKSIINGVTRLCAEFGTAIVLEDDLVTSNFFLRYMNEALKRYENDLQVMQISGHMFPAETRVEEDALFLPFTTSWGWATWSRAWSHFDAGAAGYTRLKKDRHLARRFNLNGAYDYLTMLEKQQKGEIDSWAVRWHLSTFLSAGLTLYPKRSLIQNIGFDGSGVHCAPSNISRKQDRTDLFRPEIFPSVKVLEHAKRAVYDHLAQKGSRLARIKYWMRQNLA